MVQVIRASAAQCAANDALPHLPAAGSRNAVPGVSGGLDALHVQDAEQWHPGLPSRRCPEWLVTVVGWARLWEVVQVAG